MLNSPLSKGVPLTISDDLHGKHIIWVPQMDTHHSIQVWCSPEPHFQTNPPGESSIPSFHPGESVNMIVHFPLKKRGVPSFFLSYQRVKMTKRCHGPGCPLRPSAVRWDDVPRSEGFLGSHARRSRRRSVPTWESRTRNVGSMGRQEISSIHFGVVNQHIIGVAPKKCSMVKTWD